MCVCAVRHAPASSFTIYSLVWLGVRYSTAGAMPILHQTIGDRIPVAFQ